MTRVRKQLLAGLMATIPVSAFACLTEPHLGTVCYTAAIYCPAPEYVEAKGQVLNISDNAALHSLYGTRFGGDGRTNFALPDLRGRVVIGNGRHPYNGKAYSIGQKPGNEEIYLSAQNLPPHSHAVDLAVSEASYAGMSIKGSVPVANQGTLTPLQKANEAVYITSSVGRSDKIYNSYNATENYAASMPVNIGSITGDFTEGRVSGSTSPKLSANSAIPVSQPSLALRACIAIKGSYPSRP